VFAVLCVRTVIKVLAVLLLLRCLQLAANS
jgi:hypothetical protein